jgi:hypothetical protein
MRRDWFGSFIALVVFFAGIAMIYGVFQQAWVLFETPPAKALAIEKAKPMDVNVTGTNLVWVLVRILILFLLAVCGSLIANKGVSLFAASRHLPAPKKSDPNAG